MSIRDGGNIDIFNYRSDRYGLETMEELPCRERKKSVLLALPIVISTKFAAFSLRIPDLQVFPHLRIQAFAADGYISELY